MLIILEDDNMQNQTNKNIVSIDLPVLNFEKQIKEIISNYPVAIIIGQTGSGKTTEIGRMMHEVVGGKIATTQPRRPAAINVAEYVSGKKGEGVGTSVGYHIRFNDTTNLGTALDYVTDGILIEKLLGTKVLPEYSGVILDEAHIRNLNVDFLMGLILQVNERRRELDIPQLKVLITSATIPAQQFSDFFGGAPVLEIPGKMYPVQVYYERKESENYLLTISDKVSKIIDEGTEGDILIFVPGEAEIKKIILMLKKSNLGGVEILPFFGQQSISEQEKVFLQYPNRKIIVSTNIAETSLTIDGVRIVIDSGLQRVSIFDPKSGISRLVDEPASVAAINQRKGRAGRTASGVCYRIFPEYIERPEYDIPEILRTDLSGTVLKMKLLGIKDILNFKFIDSPKPKQLKRAIRTLKLLSALDYDEEITETGKLMARLPLDPHLSRMIVEAEKYNCVDAICTIAAFMSSKSVFDRSTTELVEAEAMHRFFKLDKYGKAISDPECFLKIWDLYQSNNMDIDWVNDNYLNPKVLEEVELIKRDLLLTLKRYEIYPGQNRKVIDISKSVAAGNIFNLLERVNREEYVRVLGKGENITVHPSSALRLGELPKFMVAGDIMTNAAGYTGAFQCLPVEPRWLPEIAPEIIAEEIVSVIKNPRKGTRREKVKYFFKNDHKLIAVESRKVRLDSSNKSKPDYPN
jgi:HrpA-like RNA helicase